jgi:hypothetical protein
MFILVAVHDVVLIKNFHNCMKKRVEACYATDFTKLQQERPKMSKEDLKREFDGALVVDCMSRDSAFVFYGY